MFQILNTGSRAFRPPPGPANPFLGKCVMMSGDSLSSSDPAGLHSPGGEGSAWKAGEDQGGGWAANTRLNLIGLRDSARSWLRRV